MEITQFLNMSDGDEISPQQAFELNQHLARALVSDIPAEQRNQVADYIATALNMSSVDADLVPALDALLASLQQYKLTHPNWETEKLRKAANYMLGIFKSKAKPKSHLAMQIESKGLDQVTTEVVDGLMRKLSKTGYMFNFILAELDGASMGNEEAQRFARESGIPASEYKGAHLFEHPLIDGPDGAKTIMDAACLGMLDAPDIMLDFRLTTIDKLMRKVEVGKYNNDWK
jgi:hypothetical protein